MNYVGKLFKNFPAFGYSFVWDELPMEEGWAYVAWATENDGWLQLNNVRRASRGYLGQEVDRLVELAK